VNIQDAIDVIESVSGFTDESTPVGEAWAEVLSFIHRPAALAQPEPVAPTDEKLILSTYCNARRSYCHDGPEHHNWQRDAERGATMAGLRAVLQRYPHPAIQPVPEGPTLDCDEIDVPAWYRGDDVHVYEEGYTAGWAAGTRAMARPTP
jgi:hypothetical protein